MVLIGNTIQYLNLVSVTSGPSGEVVPPSTVNPNSYKKDVALVESQAIGLTGTSLKDARFTSDDPTNLDIKDVTTTATSLSATLTVSDTARLGSHTLSVTNARSSVTIPITVTQPLPTFEKVDAPLIASMGAAEKSYPVTITGGFLQGGDLVSVDSAGVKNPLTSASMKATPDGKSLTGNIVMPRGTPANAYSFRLTNEQHKDLKESLPTVTITVGLPAVPKINPDTLNANPSPIRRNPLAAKPYRITLKGENLNNVYGVEKPANATSVDFSDVTPATDGREVTMTVNLLAIPADKDLPADSKFRLKYGKPEDHLITSDEFAIKVEAQEAVTKVSPSSETVLIPASGSQTLVINGENLEAATIKGGDTTTPAGWKVTHVKNDSANQMSVKIEAPTGFAAANSPVTLKFSILNTNKTNSAEVAVTVKPEPPPTPSISKFQREGADVEAAAPGQTIVIFGENLKGATEVKFGSRSVPPLEKIFRTGQIRIEIPGNLAPSDQAIDVTVTTPGGTSPAKKFTIRAP